MGVYSVVIPPLDENCYFLWDGHRRAAILDPGGNPQVLLGKLDDLDLQPQAILLTHGHFDHVGAVEALAGALPHVPVYLHSADRALWDTPWRTYFGSPLYPPFSFPVRDYREGECISVGELRVQVLHTPGHTPGSVCLLAHDLLFTGDTLFRLSAGRTDLPGGDASALNASLRRLGGLEGEFRLLPGHGEESSLSWEKAHNPYLLAAGEGRA